MVVKRPNLGSNSTALATTNGSAANGALIQAVCTSYGRFWLCTEPGERARANVRGVGAANEWSASACDGTKWPFWGGFLCEI